MPPASPATTPPCGNAAPASGSWNSTAGSWATCRVQPLDGISLLLLLDGKMKERPQPLGFWQSNSGDHPTLNGGPSAWSDNRYKLVKTPKQFELYDITADIAETTDIAAEHADVVARMKGELEAWQQSVLRSFAGADYEGGNPSRHRHRPATHPTEELEVGLGTKAVFFVRWPAVWLRPPARTAKRECDHAPCRRQRMSAP